MIDEGRWTIEKKATPCVLIGAGQKVLPLAIKKDKTL
jgi:hypothetical protein